MDPNEQPPPEPSLPPAEQMRQKRLAMLNKTSSVSPSPDASQSTSASPSETPKMPHPASKENSPPAQKPTSMNTPKSAPSNPFSHLGVKNKSGLTGMAQNEGITRPQERGTHSGADTGPAAAAPPAKNINAKEENIENWTDRVLSDVFRLTLDESRKQDSHGVKLVYLPNMKEELQQSGEPIRLTAQNIDTAMVEAASKLPANKPLLDYLLPCFKRVVRASSTARRPTPEKQVVLDEAKRLCMSNCIFALTMPELFGREVNPIHDTLFPYLLRHHDNEDGVCLDFFNEAVGRIKEDDLVASIFTDAMVRISNKLAQMTMNDDYRPHVNCLVTYARYPVLLEALAKHERFLVATTPNMTKEQVAVFSETKTILGPFFRISPLQTEVTKTYFANPRTIDAGLVKTSQSALQMTLKTHQSDLTNIVNAFVRAGQTTRNRTLDWFAFIVNTNHKRRAMQVDPGHVASDGFMVNVTATLDRLCEPFMDASFSKVSKIDVDYLRRNPRVDMSDETKLNADQATSEAFYGKKAEGTSNFISEVFFLNLAAHHYGSEATNSKLKELDKDIKHFQKVEKEMTEAIEKLQNNPAQLAAAKVQHQRIINVMERSMSLRLSIQGVLTDKSMQQLSLQFMRYVTVWLLRVASQSDFVPAQKLPLPLPKEVPQEFSCLPEYALQDVVDNFKFVYRFIPDIMMSAVGDEIVALCITFLISSDYVKNPYLKSALVTLLFHGTWPFFHMKNGLLGDLLLGSDFANEHLLHGLMKFYIECESSGVSSAFYDKFNIRYEIFQVLKTIWPNTVYREQLAKESKANRQFFVQFVNLLLNDATYLLDEALGKLIRIHEYQKKLLDQTLSPEDREKTQSDLEQFEGQCQSYMSLVNETMKMMKLFTETLTDAFTMPEIVNRLAQMLDYNLETLVGPKRRSLKVEDAKKYNFDPKTLLSDFVDIYLNLGSKQEFIQAVAADGRSYKPSNFNEASTILVRTALKSSEDIAKWNALRYEFVKAKDIIDQSEIDLGEIPSDFEDPIMGILMEDPVMLPSKQIVDRSTIVQHLLSDPRDPFNRNPMTIDDVVPDDELRARVAAWKAERIATAKENLAGDAMDTSAG